MKRTFFATMIGCSLFAGSLFAKEACELELKSGVDAAGNKNPMAYNLKKIEIPASCSEFKINLTNDSGLDRKTFGHNVVVTKAADMQPVSVDGIAAGLDNEYVKSGDKRVIASTKVIGSGEGPVSLTLKVSELSASESYKFFCSFPGHTAMMQGDLVVLKAADAKKS
ncbi:MAG: azurin [Oligoflexus sp.]